MATVEHDGATLYYEEYGSGYPMLLIAPGGLNSAIEVWERATINPITAFPEYRLVAMDQRNAGRSHGPLPADPWAELIADQLAVADHLGLERFHLFGCCVGGPYVLRFIADHPDRVSAAVAEQPMGLEPANHAGWIERSRDWARELAAKRPDIDEAEAIAFVERMWARDFLVSVTREELREIRVPLAVLPGVDEIHPTEIGREVGRLVPGATTIEPWKDDTHVEGAIEKIRAFLRAHLPSEAVLR